MPRELRIDGIILAAGMSSRFGRPKQLLPLAGKPLLQHAVDNAAASALTEIVVVTGADAAAVHAEISLPERARFLYNPDYASGVASSLAAGIRALPDDAGAATILLGDQPGVSAETIDGVVDGFLDATAPAARLVYVDEAGTIHPSHPVVLGRQMWPDILKLAGDTGAQAVRSQFEGQWLQFELHGNPPPDIDTEEDYERLKQEYEDK